MEQLITSDIAYLITFFVFIFHIWNSVSYSRTIIEKIEWSHNLLVKLVLRNREYILKPHECCLLSDEEIRNPSLASERIKIVKEKLSDFEQRIKDKE